MKKLFLSFMLCAGFGLLEAAYVPAGGPLILGDPGMIARNTRGAIMQAILRNTPGVLAQANAAVVALDGRGQQFSPYEVILQKIEQSTDGPAALAAAQAIENVIMHLYDYEIYAFGGYRSGTSVFFTGIRWSNFFSDDAKATQLINELENLINVVKPHSAKVSMRLKATVYSYRNWRRNLMLTCAAYLAGDAIKHREESIACLFFNDGLGKSGDMALNHVYNIGHGTKYLVKGAAGAAQLSWNWVLKPTGKFILGGKNAFKEKGSQLVAVQAKPMVDFIPGLKNDEQALRDDLQKLEIEELAEIKAAFDNQKPKKEFKNIGVQINNSENYTWSELADLNFQRKERAARKKAWIDWMYPNDSKLADVESCQSKVSQSVDVPTSQPQAAVVFRVQKPQDKPVARNSAIELNQKPVGVVSEKVAQKERQPSDDIKEFRASGKNVINWMLSDDHKEPWSKPFVTAVVSEAKKNLLDPAVNRTKGFVNNGKEKLCEVSDWAKDKIEKLSDSVVDLLKRVA